MKIWALDRSYLWKKAFDPLLTSFAGLYIILFHNKDSRSTSYITNKVLKALKNSYPLLYFIFLRDNINCRLQVPPIISPLFMGPSTFKQKIHPILSPQT